MREGKTSWRGAECLLQVSGPAGSFYLDLLREALEVFLFLTIRQSGSRPGCV